MTAVTNVIIIPFRIVKAATLSAFLKKYVRPGSMIYVDMWKGYVPSQFEEMGFGYQVVNHSHEYKNSRDGTCTNTIEGLWRGVKVAIPKRRYNYIDIDSELSCFVWRRSNKSHLWHSLLTIFGSVQFEESKACEPLGEEETLLSDGERCRLGGRRRRGGGH